MYGTASPSTAASDYKPPTAAAAPAQAAQSGPAKQQNAALKQSQRAAGCKRLQLVRRQPQASKKPQQKSGKGQHGKCPACGAAQLSEEEQQLTRKPGRRCSRNDTDPRNRPENLLTEEFLRQHIQTAGMSLREISVFHGYTISSLCRKAKYYGVANTNGGKPRPSSTSSGATAADHVPHKHAEGAEPTAAPKAAAAAGAVAAIAPPLAPARVEAGTAALTKIAAAPSQLAAAPAEPHALEALPEVKLEALEGGPTPCVASGGAPVGKAQQAQQAHRCGRQVQLARRLRGARAVPLKRRRSSSADSRTASHSGASGGSMPAPADGQIRSGGEQHGPAKHARHVPPPPPPCQAPAAVLPKQAAGEGGAAAAMVATKAPHSAVHLQQAGALPITADLEDGKAAAVGAAAAAAVPQQRQQQRRQHIAFLQVLQASHDAAQQQQHQAWRQQLPELDLLQEPHSLMMGALREAQQGKPPPQQQEAAQPSPDTQRQQQQREEQQDAEPRAASLVVSPLPPPPPRTSRPKRGTAETQQGQYAAGRGPEVEGGLGEAAAVDMGEQDAAGSLLSLAAEGGKQRLRHATAPNPRYLPAAEAPPLPPARKASKRSARASQRQSATSQDLVVGTSISTSINGQPQQAAAATAAPPRVKPDPAWAAQQAQQAELDSGARGSASGRYSQQASQAQPSDGRQPAGGQQPQAGTHAAACTAPAAPAAQEADRQADYSKSGIEQQVAVQGAEPEVAQVAPSLDCALAEGRPDLLAAGHQQQPQGQAQLERPPPLRPPQQSGDRGNYCLHERPDQQSQQPPAGDGAELPLPSLQPLQVEQHEKAQFRACTQQQQQQQQQQRRLGWEKPPPPQQPVQQQEQQQEGWEKPPQPQQQEQQQGQQQEGWQKPPLPQHLEQHRKEQQHGWEKQQNEQQPQQREEQRHGWEQQQQQQQQQQHPTSQEGRESFQTGLDIALVPEKNSQESTETAFTGDDSRATRPPMQPQTCSPASDMPGLGPATAASAADLAAAQRALAASKVATAAADHMLGKAVAAFRNADPSCPSAMLRPLHWLALAGKGGSALQEVLAGWSSYAVDQQRHLFNVAVLVAVRGDWERLEAALRLELAD